jgi:hypothetical protein
MEYDEIELDDKNSLGTELSKLYDEIIKDVQRSRNQYPITNVGENRKSRDNLLCYLTFRKYNLENLQMRLAEQGLSSLGRLEGHVLNGIELVLKHFPIQFKAVQDSTSSDIEKIMYKEAQNILAKRSRSLLGRPRERRTTRIMVTLGVEAIHQPQLVEELLKNGMDIARINCAHGTKKEWKMIINAIHNAEERLTQLGQAPNRRCRIVMDLAGPKIRIGSMPLEVRPLQITVPKDVHKKRIKMVEGYLDSEASFTEKISLTGIDPSFVISISKGKEILRTLNVGEGLSFIDARGRTRTMVILERTSSTRIRIGIKKTIYLQEGLRLNRQKKSTLDGPVSEVQNYDNNTTDPYLCDPTKSITNKSSKQDEVIEIPENNNIRHYTNRDSESVMVGRVRPQPMDLKITSGDKLILLKTASINHHNESTKEYDDLVKISCTMPEILHKIQQGNRVFIDDGKIEAVVPYNHERLSCTKNSIAIRYDS